MLPKVPLAIVEKLRSSGQPPPWKRKLQLRRGHIRYGVEIGAAGALIRVGGRAIYSASDIGFSPAIIEDVTLS